ncbi:hypothetical protein CIPAW_16G037000 [Carya illinoinensis]|uniref:Uncharacterized protein n=1 Tax=Carya illinoinensis TaxID=32201 RepID=A0A8T1N3R8_CARIL|nr:hypothetical protein CIPAW_16G037000 [Carya illinoinensis]
MTKQTCHVLAEIKHNGRTNKINHSKTETPIAFASISVTKLLSDPNNNPHPPNSPSQITPTKSLAHPSHRDRLPEELDRRVYGFPTLSFGRGIVSVGTVFRRSMVAVRLISVTRGRVGRGEKRERGCEVVSA